jgi:hypothetical protein
MKKNKKVFRHLPDACEHTRYRRCRNGGRLQCLQLAHVATNELKVNKNVVISKMSVEE